MISSNLILSRAMAAGIAIPAFNTPYLPMIRPIVEAVRDADAFAFVDVARLEWIKFEAGGPRQVRDEYAGFAEPRHTRLHLDHIPVIDEDDLEVDYLSIIKEALALGYDSVMVDGSRLPLDENIRATRMVCDLAHQEGTPVEGELGAVLGHESGPMPSYEELYASGRGFTDPAQAERFVAETGVDWLSIAFGNVHGPITAAERKREKIRARLNIDHLQRIRDRVSVPIVLHGGSGIDPANVLEAVSHGVAKINIASDLRRPYEARLQESQEEAIRAVYDATRQVLGRLRLVGSASRIMADE